MSIDAEITKINEGIAEIHLALYKFNDQLHGLLRKLDAKLTDFDAGVNSALGKVTGVSQDVANVFSYFPGKAEYNAIVVTLLIVMNLCCLYVVYYIYQWIDDRDAPLVEDMRLFKRRIYRAVSRNRLGRSPETIETPPPTYDEYVKTADLYVQHSRNGSHSSMIAVTQP